MQSFIPCHHLAILASLLVMGCSSRNQSAPPAAQSQGSPLVTQSVAPVLPPVEPPATQRALPAGRQDILYSLQVPMPHTPWAKPYYRGALKTWILSPIVPNGDTVSLLKRFDMDYDIVSCDESWELNVWGMGDVYDKRSKKQEMGRKKEFGYATEDLTGDTHYDLLIIPTFIGWNVYPEAMRKAIVKRVQEGAGLVLISPQDAKTEKVNPNGPDEIALPVLSPFSGATTTAYESYGDWHREYGVQPPAPWTIAPGQEKNSIIRGVCWEEMPLSTAVSYHDYKKLADGATLVAEAKGTPTLAYRDVGKGRVVAINWFGGNENTSLTPLEDESKSPSWDYWEQFYNLLGRASLFAAHREPQIDVALGKMADNKVPVEVDNRLPEMDVTVHAILKDERGRIIETSDAPAHLSAGVSQQTVSLKKAPPGGTNHLELLVMDARQLHLAWGATQILMPRAAEITAVSISPDSVKNGQDANGEISIKGGGGGAALAIELRDPFGRVLQRTQKPLPDQADAKVPYSFKVENALSLVVFVRAQVMKDGDVASEKDSADLVVTADEPKFTDYEVIPWGFTARRDLWNVKAEQYRKFNVTGNSDATPQTTRAGFISKGHAEPPRRTLGIYYYWPERQQLIDAWKQYKLDLDKTKLVRPVCLSDPDVLQGVRDAVRTKVRAQKKFNPGSYYIGDESSVTAYTTEIDLDFNPKAIDAFRLWLKDRYPDIAALNEKWQTQFKTFEEIIPFTIVEVDKDPTKAVGWAEHRTFMEISYANVLKLIRDTGKAEDPNAEFELTGTQSATSFNGIDWSRHTQFAKRFVPYNINFAYDQLRCFNPGVKMFALTGYGSRGQGVKLSLWNQAFHGLLSANIFWEWSLVNPDMTLSQNAVDIGEVFGDLRGRGIGRLIGTTTWVKSPVMIYYSQPSIHAARIQKREGTPHACRNAWCQITRDLGLQFDMISYMQVEEGSWLKDPPKILILPAALAISPAEAKNIIQYVQDGGTVIADIDPAMEDDRCDVRNDKLLETLFGDSKTPGVKDVGKGKAVLLGKAFTGYEKQRGKKDGADSRTEIAKLFADYHVIPTVPITVAQAPSTRPDAPVSPSPLTHAETVLMEHGGMRLLGILKENLTGIRRTTPDGVEYFEPLPEGQSPPTEQISANLGRAWHVYDVRAGKYLGSQTVLQDELHNADAKLYALLPYQVKSVSLKTTGTFAPGALLNISAAVVTDGGDPGDHTFNIRVFGQDDHEIRYYARNIIAAAGRADFTLPVELNPPGPFKLVVTDVATGVRQSHDFGK